MEKDRIAQIVEKRPYIKYNNFSIDIRDIQSGIIFLFASWSSTLVQLHSLIESLEKNNSITVYIYDIDHHDFGDYKVRNNLTSEGWGETYWVKNGKVITMLKKYDSKDSRQIFSNNISVLSPE